jgi:hypothetical protein
MRYRRPIVVVGIIMAVSVSVLLLFSLLTIFSTSPPTEAKKGPLVTNKVHMTSRKNRMLSYSSVYKIKVIEFAFNTF